MWGIAIQQRSGDPNDTGRDLIYDFKLTPIQDEDLSFGRSMMRAAFHFINIHLRKDTILSTNAIQSVKCPFYTVCSQDFRKTNPETVQIDLG